MVSKVFVIGLGMGNPDTLTCAAHDALSSCELIIGAQRLLDALDAYDVPKRAGVAPADIVRELTDASARTACVVMSGDVGFYSGADRLYPLLQATGVEIEVLPGVSSLSYLCARLHVPWQDVHVVSAHGRADDVAGAVQAHARTFVLTGGTRGAAEICGELVACGLGGTRVCVGERLSYHDERIVRGTAEELSERTFASLSVLLVENDQPIERTVGGPSLPDEAFVRGSVPMTKEEVRALVICKLQIRPSDVVWDVGAGTGSVSVEAARAACTGQVWAIERNPDACDLTTRNARLFGLTNLRVVEGAAPQALAGLPAPDRVFVGGSSGQLAAIVHAALEANPCVRICIAAITLETLAAAVSCLREERLRDVDITQLTVAKVDERAGYHMMRGTNPVFLVCAQGTREQR